MMSKRATCVQCIRANDCPDAIMNGLCSRFLPRSVPKIGTGGREKVRMVDTLEIVLRKADGRIITNTPKPITEEYLRDIMRNQNERIK